MTISQTARDALNRYREWKSLEGGVAYKNYSGLTLDTLILADSFDVIVNGLDTIPFAVEVREQGEPVSSREEIYEALSSGRVDTDAEKNLRDFVNNNDQWRNS